MKDLNWINLTQYLLEITSCIKDITCMIKHKDQGDFITTKLQGIYNKMSVIEKELR